MKPKRARVRKSAEQRATEEANEAVRKAAGQRLREARKAAGLSVGEVAAALGYKEQTVYRYEWGVNECQVDDLRTLADLFGTTVGWLANAESPRKSA